MQLPSIIQLAKSAEVEFVRFEDHILWYRAVYYITDINFNTFDFPVPVEDTAGGVFLARDTRPLYFMRWMRKHLEMLTKAQQDG